MIWRALCFIFSISVIWAMLLSRATCACLFCFCFFLSRILFDRLLRFSRMTCSNRLSDILELSFSFLFILRRRLLALCNDSAPLNSAVATLPAALRRLDTPLITFTSNVRSSAVRALDEEVDQPLFLRRIAEVDSLSFCRDLNDSVMSDCGACMTKCKIRRVALHGYPIGDEHSVVVGSLNTLSCNSFSKFVRFCLSDLSVPNNFGRDKYSSRLCVAVKLATCFIHLHHTLPRIVLLLFVSICEFCESSCRAFCICVTTRTNPAGNVKKTFRNQIARGFEIIGQSEDLQVINLSFDWATFKRGNQLDCLNANLYFSFVF